MSVTSQPSMTYVSLIKNGDGALQLRNGIFVEVFKELSHRLNFSFTVVNPPDGEWGVLKGDGTWSGMVGQLETKKVDIAVTDFTITEQRSRVMKFSTPLDEIYCAIIIQNPVNTYHFEAYTSPLTNVTWLILLAWIIATPPILFIVSRCIICKSMLCMGVSIHYHLCLMLLTSDMGSLMKISMSSHLQRYLSWLVEH